MATAHCSLFFLLPPSTTTRTSPLFIVSSIPSSRSSRITHRKNYLRPKILKTLPQPILPLLPQEPPPPPPQSAPSIPCPQFPEEENLHVEIASDGESIAADAGENDNSEDLQVSEATAEVEHNDVSGNVSAAAIFKYGGVFLVGAFVFQSIYSVLFLGSYTSSQKGHNFEINERKKRIFLFNGNGNNTMHVPSSSNKFYEEGHLVEMEKKIQEIKLMAREVRRIEEMTKEEEDEDSDMDDDGATSSHRLGGIEREIGTRLSKLQSRINSNKDSSAALQINSLKGNKYVNQGSEELMFKKKLKFKSPSTKPSKTPKGFSGTKDHRAPDAKKRNSTSKGKAQDNGGDANDDNAQILYEDKRVNQQDVDTQESIPGVLLEETREFVDDKSKANHGGVHETSFGMSSHEQSSRELRTQNSKGFVEENQDTGPNFEKDEVHSINGSSGHGLSKNNSAANRVKVKQANTKTDKWWLNLQYVLVILMQRGSNREGARGLYSLNFTSEQDQSDDSYMVAFEDQADANNFCFLLESFFKDLGDFSADAVPMSIQELDEELISRAKKVVVVKKRQLQLYAGQPLTDVEMALCSLIEQGQNIS